MVLEVTLLMRMIDAPANAWFRVPLYGGVEMALAEIAA